MQTSPSIFVMAEKVPLATEEPKIPPQEKSPTLPEGGIPHPHKEPPVIIPPEQNPTLPEGPIKEPPSEHN